MQGKDFDEFLAEKTMNRTSESARYRDRWSEAEKEKWRMLTLKYGKDFRKIAKQLGTKTETQC